MKRSAVVVKFVSEEGDDGAAAVMADSSQTRIWEG